MISSDISQARYIIKIPEYFTGAEEITSHKMHEDEASTTTSLGNVVIVETAEIISDPLGGSSSSTSESPHHQDANSSSNALDILIGKFDSLEHSHLFLSASS